MFISASRQSVESRQNVAAGWSRQRAETQFSGEPARKTSRKADNKRAEKRVHATLTEVAENVKRFFAWR